MSHMLENWTSVVLSRRYPWLTGKLKECSSVWRAYKHSWLSNSTVKSVFLIYSIAISEWWNPLARSSVVQYWHRLSDRCLFCNSFIWFSLMNPVCSELPRLVETKEIDSVGWYLAPPWRRLAFGPSICVKTGSDLSFLRKGDFIL